jgi:hypothetical protein
MTRRDPNVAIGGQAYALLAIVPIRAGHKAPLRRRLAALGRDGPSPFARVPAIHFARLVILDRLPHEGPPRLRQVLHQQHLLFSSVSDGGRDRLVDQLCRRMPDTLDAVFDHCDGAPHPPSADPQAFGDWIGRHQLDTAAFFAPYGDATVDEVRASLALRERIAEFAVRMQYAPARQLQAEFERELAEAAR